MVTNGGASAGGGPLGGSMGGGAMGSGTMVWSFRAGQPTNAAVTKRAFAMTMIFKNRERFFTELPPATKGAGG